MSSEQDQEYSLDLFGIVKVELWAFILILNGFLLIVSYSIYKVVFFYGYQVSLDKTLKRLQDKSENILIEKKKAKS